MADLQDFRKLHLLLLVLLVMTAFGCGQSGGESMDEAVDSEPLPESEPGEEGFKEGEGSLTGKMTYHFPDTMKTDQTERFELTISKNISPEVLQEHVPSFSDTAATSSETIEIGRKMKATLIDPSPPSSPNFHVVALGNSTQHVSLEDGTFTLWQWDVTPLRPGAHPLILSVEITIINDLGEVTKNIPVFDSKIYVAAQEVSAAEKARTFFEQNWEWLISTFFIPVFIWLIRRRRPEPNQKKK